MLMRVVKKESDRRIQFLIADKSMKRKFIGAMAGLTGVVPVGRAMDATKPANGKIYLPDPINDPCLVRGIDTNFEGPLFMVGGSLVLPKVDNKAATAEILEINGPQEIRLKRGFKGGIAMQQLTGRNDMTKDGTFIDSALEKKGVADGFEGINFLVAPKLDQTEVYDAVHTVLHHGGSIGIFPEGGSHDRTDLLPLKGKFTTCLVLQMLILVSWCCYHGFGYSGFQAGLQPEDYSSGHELFPCAQVPFKGCYRIRYTS